MWLSAQDSDEAEQLPVSRNKLPFFQSRSVLAQIAQDSYMMSPSFWSNILDFYFTPLTATVGKNWPFFFTFKGTFLPSH